MGIKKYLKSGKKLTIGLLMACLMFTACQKEDNANTTKQVTEQAATDVETESGDTAESETEEETFEVTLQNDFYQTVNAEWLSTAEIPSDQASVGGFDDISKDIEDTLIADLGKMLEEGIDKQEGSMAELLKYYEMALDFEQRERDGVAQILDDLETVYNISSLEEFNDKAVEFQLQAYGLPFMPYVMADMKDTSINTIYLSPAGLSLFDKSYYDETDPTAEYLLQVYEQMLTDLFVLTGKTQEEATTLAQEAVAFEKLVAEYQKSAEESSVYTDMYNPVTLEELTAYSQNINLVKFISGVLGQEPAEVIVTDVNYFRNLDEILNEENVPLLRSWMAAQIIQGASGYLTEEFRQVSSTVNMLMSGMTELSDKEVSAFYGATNIYGEVLGKYFGETYFGEEAKEDVTGMVNEIIATYKTRLQNNDWLGEDSIAAAIRKLDNITVKIGYPDVISEIYSQFIVTSYEEGGTFYSNASNFTLIALRDNYSKYGQPVNKENWSITADTVNAIYNPFENSICFTAAILQDPFYNINRTKSENYGAIGMIIGHEITHAFDNNGSSFDEFGNLNDWWTEEDYAVFNEKTSAMAELFDGVEHAGGTVNGTLTVGENVADAGGLSCAQEITSNLPDGDLEAFFKTYAIIWRFKATEQYEQLLLTVDNHAPGKLRTNLQLSNLDVFYEVFQVKEGDGMYLAPEERVSIW